MRRINRNVSCWGFGYVLLFGSLGATDAQAYVDPGTTGLLSQILYVVFYAALGVFLYYLRYVKEIFARGRRHLAKLFFRRIDDEPSSDRSHE